MTVDIESDRLACVNRWSRAMHAWQTAPSEATAAEIPPTKGPPLEQPPPTGFILALEEARRGADAQMGDLSALRERAGTTVGVGGLAATILGSLALRDNAPLTLYTWVGLGAFVALAVLCLVIFLPLRLYSSQDPAILVNWVEQRGATTRQMERDLALFIGQQHDKNQPKLDRRAWLLFGAVLSLTVELVAFIADLSSR